MPRGSRTNATPESVHLYYTASIPQALHVKRMSQARRGRAHGSARPHSRSAEVPLSTANIRVQLYQVQSDTSVSLLQPPPHTAVCPQSIAHTCDGARLRGVP